MIWQKERRPVFLAIGEAMIEIAAKDFPKAKVSYGGDTLNTLVYFKRLTKKHDFLVKFVTRFGDDEITKKVLSKLKAERIDISSSNFIKNRNSGLYVIELDENNERKFHYWRSFSPAKELLSQAYFMQEKQDILDSHYIYFSGISIAILEEQSKYELLKVIAKAKQNGQHIIFDLNLRSKLWLNKRDYWYDKFLSLSDVVFGSWDDILELKLDLEKYNIKEQILRKSDHSCQVIIKDYNKNTSMSVNHKHQIVSKVVDTTAAGDAFSAGYLASRITGGEVIEALKVAFSVASVVVGQEGAIVDSELLTKYTIPLVI